MAETVPEVGDKVIGEPFVPILLANVEEVETWNPAGGLIEIPAAKFEPDTEKLVFDEAVP